ncbi:MAG TPA: hypothetical protein VMT63_12720 [Bacteroidales bacterium]|nr:hypothetical protein [Bacteroidales bacterium]
MDILKGLLTPVTVYIVVLVLNLILPGKWVKGYISHPGTEEKLNYHLNGFLVFLVTIAAYFIACFLHALPWDWFFRFRWYSAAGACIIGLIASFAVVLPYPRVRNSFFADLYLGRIENLQFRNGRVDSKMWLYLAGATMLGLNVTSFAARHFMLFKSAFSPGVAISALLMLFFIVDYLTFEEVHLYTYDLFAERVGFKLGWGCLVFYAYFYSVFLWATVELPDAGTPVFMLVLYVFTFFSGWVLSRGANLQKYFFKKYPGKMFLMIAPETISDGKRSLLVNGFWGVSRHVNYLGEILMAAGMILCTGHPGMIWPWLYPLYYVGLLFTRQADDDRRCKNKYGALWDEYKKRVPYRIIPFIY